jgi:hypothetical protein
MSTEELEISERQEGGHNGKKEKRLEKDNDGEEACQEVVGEGD